MTLTEDQILQMAPDDSSRKSGKDLANPAKWGLRGASPTALWGECQGSGSKPYQTAIDLGQLAFKCSCPSRKFPCKHGIALGLLYARNSAAFADGDAPAWVQEWIGKRAAKEEEKTVKESKAPDPAAQAKRQQARESKVDGGVSELLLWLEDIVRGGILQMPEKEPSYFYNMARRMVDAQAGGLATLLRGLAATPFFEEGWQSGFLDKLAELYLLCRAWQNAAQLSEGERDELRQWIGFTISQEALRAGEGLRDTWLVAGKQVSDEDNITVERNWLYGLNTGRSALLLQFIVRGQPASGLLLGAGTYIDAELAFYPGVNPQRALLKEQRLVAPGAPAFLFNGWNDVAEAECTQAARFPVRASQAFAVRALTPVATAGGWWLRDAEGRQLPLSERFAGRWKLLSLSGGAPLDMVLVGKENTFIPIGAWHRQTYKVL